MRTIYNDLDLTDIHFTGHLLNTLASKSPEDFKTISQELRRHWVTKMSGLLERIGGKIVLLWLADRAPDDAEWKDQHWSDPGFLNRDMIDQIAGAAFGVVEVVATPDEIHAGHERMYFSQMDEPAARQRPRGIRDRRSNPGSPDAAGGIRRSGNPGVR